MDKNSKNKKVLINDKLMKIKYFQWKTKKLSEDAKKQMNIRKKFMKEKIKNEKKFIKCNFFGEY